MQLITPSVELWKQGYSLNDLYDHIARCTKVCYQTDVIKDNESSFDFINRTILRHTPKNTIKNHKAMLEHGTVYLSWLIDLHYSDTNKYKNNKYSRVIYSKNENGEDVANITTNYRVIVENNWNKDLGYLCKPNKYHYRRLTVCFITNIGVSREANRHRVNSIAEESTRYCNYSKDKFSKQIAFTVPAWIKDGLEKYLYHRQYLDYNAYLQDIENTYNDYELDNTWCDLDYYMFSLRTAEKCYNGLIRKGWSPQKAREVLPLATKTQLIHTAFLDDWRYFLKLRNEGVSGTPHPNMKYVANELDNLLIDYGEL